MSFPTFLLVVAVAKQHPHMHADSKKRIPLQGRELNPGLLRDRQEY